MELLTAESNQEEGSGCKIFTPLPWPVEGGEENTALHTNLPSGLGLWRKGRITAEQMRTHIWGWQRAAAANSALQT